MTNVNVDLQDCIQSTALLANLGIRGLIAEVVYVLII